MSPINRRQKFLEFGLIAMLVFASVAGLYAKEFSDDLRDRYNYCMYLKNFQNHVINRVISLEILKKEIENKSKLETIHRKIENKSKIFVDDEYYAIMQFVKDESDIAVRTYKDNQFQIDSYGLKTGLCFDIILGWKRRLLVSFAIYSGLFSTILIGFWPLSLFWRRLSYSKV